MNETTQLIDLLISLKNDNKPQHVIDRVESAILEVAALTGLPEVAQREVIDTLVTSRTEEVVAQALIPKVGTISADVLYDENDADADTEFSSANRSGLVQYFTDRSINTVFNTLGHSSELALAYIADTQQIIAASGDDRSEYSKATCYSQYFSMAPRQKLTGFEAFDDLALQFKIKMSSEQAAEFLPVLAMRPGNSIGKYNLRFSNSIQTKYPGEKLLYLSGGLDSELVALFMLQSNISFKPVIFKWLDSQGAVANEADITYAFTFCTEHNLIPLVREVNIPELWGSAEFEQLANACSLISAHVTTHAHMVNLMAAEFPGQIHMFGGEVRYRANLLLNDGTSANLVKLAKTSLLMSGTYTHTGVSSVVSGLSYSSIIFSLSKFSWDFSWNTTLNTVSNNFSGSPTSGTWHTGTPAVAGYTGDITCTSWSPAQRLGAPYTSSVNPTALATVTCDFNPTNMTGSLSASNTNTVPSTCDSTGIFSVTISSNGGLISGGFTLTCNATLQ